MNSKPMRPLKRTRRDDIVEVIGGVLVTDPYRWLEEESAESLAWQAEQNLHSDKELRDWPGFEKLKTRIAELIAPLDLTAPRQCRSKWLRLENDIEGSRLVISKTVGGDGTVVQL